MQYKSIISVSYTHLAGCGLWDSLPQALEILRVQEVTEPSKDAERYEAPYQTYTKLYQALKAIEG